MPVSWNDSNFKKSTKTKALDGVEELARTKMLTTAKERCPVKDGIMRGSLGVERDDANSCVYLGGGGPSKDYIFRQHQDTSLNHRVGQAKFISSAVEEHSSELKEYIEKHTK
jgi:hypothetical protein